MGCHIWNSEEGPGRAADPSSPLLAVPNVTAHPSTASVPITVLLLGSHNSTTVELRRRVAIDTSPTQLNSTRHRVELSCVAITCVAINGPLRVAPNALHVAGRRVGHASTAQRGSHGPATSDQRFICLSKRYRNPSHAKIKIRAITADLIIYATAFSAVQTEYY